MTPDDSNATSRHADPADVPEMDRAPDTAANEWSRLVSGGTPKEGRAEDAPHGGMDYLPPYQPAVSSTADHSSPIAVRTPPPIAKRLNRNALTVAAVIAGVTVLVAVVLVQPSKTSASAGSSASASPVAAPLPARPTFLDQPPKVAPSPSPADSVAASLARGGPPSGVAQARQLNPPGPGLATTVRADATPLGGIGATSPPATRAPSMGVPSLDQVGDPSGAMGGPLAVPGAPLGVPSGAPSPRHIAYQAALVSSVLIEELASRAATSRAPEEATPDASAGSSTVAQTPAGSPLDRRAAPSPVTGGGMVSPFVGPRAANESAHGTPIAPEPTSVSAHFEPAGALLTLRAGTLIPGLLLTGVNSDLPGQVLAQTSRNVFDSRTEQQLLIPKGSRLVGVYDSHTVGSGRLVVTWTRLILPDGRSLRLPGLPAQDETGQTGVHDQVNHHYGRIYGNALLLSVLSAGLQLSQPQQTSALATPSTRQVAAGAVGQEMADVSTESIRRGMDIPPTITIRPAMAFNVFLTGDIAFDSPYTPVP